MFWNNKKVLVTGGHGFLGTQVVAKLKQAGAHVIAPTHQEFNLVEEVAVKEMYAQNPDVEMVIHLAGRVGGIGATKAHPGSFFYENLMMGTLLLHNAYVYHIPKFIAFSTVCAYPKNAPVPFKEEDLWEGYPEETNAPYGLAKKMMLVQSEAYRQQYGYNSIFLLPVNMYGPGDNFNPEDSHVIPALIKKCIDASEAGEKEIVVWGDGSATREFLYVTDAAEAILLAGEKYDKSDPVNLGSTDEISIKELVDIIVKETGFKGKVTWDASKPNGQPRRKLDVSKAKVEFGFASSTPFNEGLRQTIAWYRKKRQNPS